MPVPDPIEVNEGFSLIEFITVTVIVFVLLWFAIDRLFSLRSVAERLAFEQNFTKLRTAALSKLTQTMTQDTPIDYDALRLSNPMEWDMQPPANYLGTLDAPDLHQIPGQRWYFDRSQALLIYRIEHAGQFDSQLTGPPRIRLKVHLIYADKDHDGAFTSGTDLVTGLTIVAAEPFSWQPYASDE